MNRNPIPKQSKKRLAEIAAGTYKPKVCGIRMGGRVSLGGMMS